MFVLVEPLNTRYLVERPDLGCATLVAVSRGAGWQTRLVVGQVEYLPEVLSTFADEVWSMLAAAGPDQLRRAGFDAKALAAGRGPFVASLHDLLDRVARRQSWRDHLDVRAVHELRAVFLPVMALYEDACSGSSSPPLSFIDWYVERIVRHEPSCVGFSINTALDPVTRAIAERLGRSDVPLIAGGAWTHGWDLERATRMLADLPFDAIVVGPAEESLPGLLEALRTHHWPARLANVVSRHRGVPRQADLQPLADLDTQPAPDFDDYDLDRFPTPERVLPLRTSAGCSWGRCAFCAYPVNSFRTCVQQDARAVAGRLELLGDRYSCRQFLLHDDELSPERARELSDALIARSSPVRLSAYARLERGFLDDGLLERMHAAGFRTLMWGLESGSDRVLKLMRKGTTASLAGAVLDAAARAGLSNHCFVMIGFPGETREEVDATVAFLREHAEAIDSIGLQAFVATPDSPVGREPGRWGLRLTADGSHEVESGLSAREATTLVRVVQQRHELGDPGLTSRRARLLQSASGFAVSRVAVLAHGPLDPAEGADRLTDSPASVYPLLAGDFEGELWRPVDFTQTLTLARLRPPPPIRLDPRRRELVALADGTRSAADLGVSPHPMKSPVTVRTPADAASAVPAGHEPEGFLRSCLARGLGLAFTEPLPR